MACVLFTESALNKNSDTTRVVPYDVNESPGLFILFEKPEGCLPFLFSQQAWQQG